MSIEKGSGPEKINTKEYSTEKDFWHIFSDANNQFEAVRKTFQIYQDIKKLSQEEAFLKVKEFILSKSLVSLIEYLKKDNRSFSQDLLNAHDIEITEYNYLVERMNDVATFSEFLGILDSADTLKNNPTKNEE